MRLFFASLWQNRKSIIFSTYRRCSSFCIYLFYSALPRRRFCLSFLVCFYCCYRFVYECWLWFVQLCLDGARLCERKSFSTAIFWLFRQWFRSIFRPWLFAVVHIFKPMTEFPCKMHFTRELNWLVYTLQDVITKWRDHRRHTRQMRNRLKIKSNTEQNNSLYNLNLDDFFFGVHLFACTSQYYSHIRFSCKQQHESNNNWNIRFTISWLHFRVAHSIANSRKVAFSKINSDILRAT